MEFDSPVLEAAVTELSRLPGVGRKTALRFALHLLRQDENIAYSLGRSIVELRRDVHYCPQCYNITSGTGLCPVCADRTRDSRTILVVETVKDVLSFESTRQYSGVYHVLGGIISPMEGISPDMLQIDALVRRIADLAADKDAASPPEVILALNATMEGETTAYYIYRALSAASPAAPVKITQLSRGISVAGEIQYTDELTLARSLHNRTLFTLNT